MTNSWWYNYGYNQRTYHAGDIQATHSTLPANGSVVQMKRVGSTISLVDDGVTLHTWSQTSSAALRFTVSNDGTANADQRNGIKTPYVKAVTSATSATGTLIQSANTVASAKTKVGGVMFYKDNAGTATIGTDLKIYFSCNNGGAWTEAASYNAITPVYSSGIKQVRLGETTCTEGNDIRYKAVWANQSASKDTQLHGIGINY